MNANKQYPQHPNYKDSGESWLGQIPAHWEVRKFRFNFKFNSGLNITKKNLIENGVPCVNYGEIHSKYPFKLNPKKNKLKCVDHSYLKNNSHSLVNSGDFVFADTSEDIEGSGNFTCLESDEAIFAGYHTIIARSINKINAKYVSYVFDSLSYRNQIRSKVKGVKVYSITQGLLKETFFWLPTKAEQQQIADYLDHKTALIEKAVALKQQQIALLQERLQILIQNAVTKGLNPQAPLENSNIDWLGQIPAHWEVKKLKFFSVIKNGEDHKNFQTETGYPVFGSGGKFANASKYLHNGEAVLLGRKGTIDKPLYVNEKFWTVDTMFYCVCNKSISTKFIYYCATQIPFSYYSTSTALPSMKQSDLLNHIIAFPPPAEQQQIADYLDKKSAETEQAIALMNQQIKLLQEYKNILINEAVTGKIRL